MAKIVWGGVGERFYEAGTDRGVLYIGNTGVPWNGLTGVKEKSSGGDPQPYYLDGFKYNNVAAAEEFEATIEAYSSPREFAVCDGSVSLGNGLYVTQQRRQKFGFSYRTRIGNDVDGLDHGYKIHLVYEALAAPADRDYGTINDSLEPLQFSWDISTLPKVLPGIRPTAHFVVDTREAPADVLAELEDILYGTETTSPRLISPTELAKLFEPFVPFTVEVFEDGSYTAEGTAVELVGGGAFTLDDDTVVDNGDGSFTIM